MPIQFHCNKCQGWIEVDDEHAGGKAICPFCQAVNAVPGEARKPSTARPAEGAEPTPAGESPAGKGPYTGVPTEPTRPGMPEVPVSKPLEERERARRGRAEGDFGRFDAGRAGLPPPAPGSLRLTRIGLFGLVGTIVSFVLMIVPITAIFRHLPEPLREQISTSQELTPEQAKDLQKKTTEELPNIVQERPWIQWLFLFSLLLWIASLVLNLSVIFAAGPHRRTYAWAGVAINPILLFLCMCSGIMQRFMGS
jgi:hypothetical protein